MANSVQYNGGSGLLHYMNGLLLEWVDVDAVAVNVGQCDNRTSTAILTVRDLISLDLTTVGAGGLDVGTLFASQFYYVYLIAGPQVGVNAVASLSTTGPVMPAGYETYRKLDSFRTDSAVHVLRFTKSGTGRDRRTDWQDYTAQLQLLSNATAPVTEGDINCVPAMPVGARRIIMSLIMEGSDVSSNVQIQQPTITPDPSGQLAFGLVGATSAFYTVPQYERTTNAARHLGFFTADCTLSIVAQGYYETI